MNSREAIKALKNAGFVEKRHEGSHKHFEHATYPDLTIPVPCHGGRDLKLYEAAKIRAKIRQAQEREKKFGESNE